jgi:HAD superfamily hydrolase (TIGR01549 family)
MKSLPRPALLLLDAGNTLVYLDHDTLAEIAASAGFEVTTERLRQGEAVAKRRYEEIMARGVSHELGWDLYMQVVYESAGLTPEQSQRSTVLAREEHDRFNLWRKVPAGLIDALGRARMAGLRLGVVSNSEGKLAELLVRVGLMELLELVIDSGLEGVRKPDPEIFRRALGRLGVPASQALYAGDIPNVDVVGARAAGMEAVLIDTLDHYPTFKDAPRFHSVTALLEAMGI